MPDNSQPIVAAPQRKGPQAADGRRDRANAPKRVPSALPVNRRAEAVASFVAGRNVHQVAKDYCVSEAVALELVTRELYRRINAMRDQMFAMDRRAA